MKLLDRLPLYSTRDGYSCGYGGIEFSQVPRVPAYLECAWVGSILNFYIFFDFLIF